MIEAITATPSPVPGKVISLYQVLISSLLSEGEGILLNVTVKDVYLKYGNQKRFGK